MAKMLNLVTVLILTTYHCSLTFGQFNSEPALKYRSRKSGSERFHMQRKASGLTDLYTGEFLKEIQARMEGHPALKGPGSKVPHQWQAAVETRTRKGNAQRNQSDDENVAEKKRGKAGKKGRKKKEESEESEDNDPTSSQIVEVKKKQMSKGRHSEKSEEKHHKRKKTESPKNCNKKCFEPNCEVECTGPEASAACSALGCKALARGEDSASLCSGDKCRALCFKDECISGCEGVLCLVKCHGKRCHSVSEGSESQSTCIKDECMAYGNGEGTQIKCEGESCQAQCMGEKCIAECNGTNCVSGCTGKGCQATCQGKNCVKLEHIAEGSVVISKEDSTKIKTTKKDDSEDDGYYGNKHFIEKNKPAVSDSKTDSKERIKTPKVVEIINIKHDTNSEEDSDSAENVRLDYSVDIRLTPSLVGYIRDKIYQLKKVAGYLPYLNMRH